MTGIYLSAKPFPGDVSAFGADDPPNRARPSSDEEWEAVGREREAKKNKKEGRAEEKREAREERKSTREGMRLQRIEARRAIRELKIQTKKEIAEARIKAREEIARARVDGRLAAKTQKQLTKEHLAQMKKDFRERKAEIKKEIKEGRTEAREAKTEARNETAQRRISAREERQARRWERAEKRKRRHDEKRVERVEKREQARQEREAKKAARPPVHWEPTATLSFVPHDSLSLEERPDIELNTSQNLAEGGEPYRFPSGFEAGFGVELSVHEIFSLGIMGGAGYAFREGGTSSPAQAPYFLPPSGTTYLEETRLFVGVEPLVRLPKDHNVQFVFGGGTRGFGSLLTSKPLGTISECYEGDGQGGCLESVEQDAYGIPVSDKGFMQLDSHLGFGGLFYGKIGLNLGPVRIGLRAGRQFLVFSNPDIPEGDAIKYSGPFVGIDSQVRF